MDAVSEQPLLALPEPPHMLDRDQLETFATVVEQQSFDRAASVLSITRGAVSQRIKALELTSRKQRQTQLVIETPYRNTALLQSLLQTLQTNTRLATSSGLTLATACTHSQTVKHWKHSGWALDNATPTVFALGR